MRQWLHDPRREAQRRAAIQGHESSVRQMQKLLGGSRPAYPADDVALRSEDLGGW